ncbi:hypothetical protein QCA50_019024 [Cerrena zonata]|uniref:amidase n=2 Tax=Dikarya TaxID=451864 RepID=A0AAW0FG94_9APHY
MSISHTSFLTLENFEGFENAEKYASFVPKLEAYRKKLEDAILPEYSIELPGDIDELKTKQFNPLKYIYEKNLLSEAEFNITDTPASELVPKLAKGELTAVEVFRAFAKRATIAHQFTNCAMEIFNDEGLERAKYLDEYLAKEKKPIGPLHGLPISLKEHMHYKGKATHAGYVSLVDNITPKHGNTTQILENLGAVFYIRTNEPQTLMHLCSNNNFVGAARNPHNLGLSPGGSSSGEGSIVGFGGSPIGIGSDIGGSIRGPAAFSGCIGLRPTSKRVSLAGGVSSGAGQESVPAVQGPMTRSVDDIDFWMSIYINQGKPWETDCNVIPLPWRKVDVPKVDSLTIAVMYDDGLVKPTPPIQRGLKVTADKLSKAGAKVVEFKPIKTKLAYDTVHKMYCCDGNDAQKSLLAESGEPLTKLTQWNLNFGDGGRPFSITENRQLNIIRDALKQEYTDFLNENKIDFILSPTYNNVAPRPEEIYNWSYTSLFNILDLPTLAFQTGLFQDPKVDKWDDSHSTYEFRSDLEKLELDNYIPENFTGAPIGLQLSGRRYFDEEVVAAGKSITKALGADLYKVY